jgi:hypothetical protein
MERIEGSFSSGWIRTEAGIEEKEERLDALDFSWERSSSLSAMSWLKMSLVEFLVEGDEDEG